MMPLILAMHMSDSLLSLPVAVATLVLAFAAVAIAARRSRKSLDAERLPLMGVMGAFVFAAQMINFPLPGLGTSGHLGGAVLLTILLGPANAIVTMAAILIVQCLLFQDGGLLALGCNIINMGIVPSLVGWAIWRAVIRQPARVGAGRLYVAAWLACLVGVVAGAALVPLQVAASGIAQVPVLEFEGVMIGLHLLIALGEGLITFAALAYLRRTRPAVLGLEPVADAPQRLGRRALAGSILVTAMLLGGVISWFASEHPDGLEQAWSQMTGKYGSPAPHHEAAAKADQPEQAYAPMPEYNWRWGWVSLAGLVGTGVTLTGVSAWAWLIGRRRLAEEKA